MNLLKLSFLNRMIFADEYVKICTHAVNACFSSLLIVNDIMTLFEHMCNITKGHDILTKEKKGELMMIMNEKSSRRRHCLNYLQTFLLPKLQ
jgi:hypothetical protein